MPTKILNRETNLDEVINILKIEYPNYLMTKERNFLNQESLIINTKIKGIYRVKINGKVLIVEPKFSILLAFVIGLTVIGAILLIISFNNNPVCKEIISFVDSKFHETSSITNDSSTNLESCPQCKNPNTNRSNFCEWCGNQIA